MKKIILILFIALVRSSFGQSAEVDNVNKLVNSWHKCATDADFEGYFSKMDENSIFIGTDKTEHWTKEEFMDFSKKYFDQGKAWDFKTIERNVYFSKNGDIAWFDELIDTWMGVCRSSGVLIKTDQNEWGWLISHYQLSVTIDNDKIQNFVELTKK